MLQVLQAHKPEVSNPKLSLAGPIQRRSTRHAPPDCVISDDMVLAWAVTGCMFPDCEVNDCSDARESGRTLQGPSMQKTVFQESGWVMEDHSHGPHLLRGAVGNVSSLPKPVDADLIELGSRGVGVEALPGV